MVRRVVLLVPFVVRRVVRRVVILVPFVVRRVVLLVPFVVFFILFVVPLVLVVVPLVLVEIWDVSSSILVSWGRHNCGAATTPLRPLRVVRRVPVLRVIVLVLGVPLRVPVLVVPRVPVVVSSTVREEFYFTV